MTLKLDQSKVFPGFYLEYIARTEQTDFNIRFYSLLSKLSLTSRGVGTPIDEGMFWKINITDLNNQKDWELGNRFEYSNLSNEERKQTVLDFLENCPAIKIVQIGGRKFCISSRD